MSLCGPIAVAHITGQDYREVVAHIRWLREGQGKRVSLKGGTYLTELESALNAAGHVADKVFPWPRRIRLADLAAKRLTGRWLFKQARHYFAVRSGRELQQLARRSPRAVVVAGWRITKAAR